MGRIKKALSNRWGAYSIAAIAGVVAYMILNNLPAVRAWLSSAMAVVSPIIIGAIPAVTNVSGPGVGGTYWGDEWVVQACSRWIPRSASTGVCRPRISS